MLYANLLTKIVDILLKYSIWVMVRNNDHEYLQTDATTDSDLSEDESSKIINTYFKPT